MATIVNTGRRPATAMPWLQLERLEERTVPSIALPTDSFLFTPVPFGTELALHIHPVLQIFVDGQKVTIPANTGVGPSSAFPIHTHDATGIVHVESPVPHTFYLLDFFAIWNLYPSGQTLMAQLGSANDITTTANGTTTDGLTNVVLLDKENIVVEALLPNPDPVTAANEAYVSRVYQDLLHRAVDPVALAQFTTALDQGLPRAQFVQTIESSQEYLALEVEQLYSSVLHRSADQVGLAAFTSFLANGGTVEQVEAMLLGSDEFYQLAGGTNDRFLSAVYTDVLQRGIDATGETAWSTVLDNGATRTTVAADILQSGEADKLRIEGFYQAFLHRPADAPSLAAFTADLQQGMLDGQIVAILLSSNEYFAD